MVGYCHPKKLGSELFIKLFNLQLPKCIHIHLMRIYRNILNIKFKKCYHKYLYFVSKKNYK